MSTEQRPTTTLIAAGTLLQGDDHHYPEEAPVHPVDVAEFELDVHPVTNFQFAQFVSATGHVTPAEGDGCLLYTSPSPRDS